MMINKVSKYIFKKTWKYNLVFIIVITILSVIYALSDVKVGNGLWIFILLGTGQGSIAETVIFADKFIYQIPAEKEELIKGVRKYLVIKNLIIFGILFSSVILKNILSFQANVWEIIALIGVSIIGYIVTSFKNSYGACNGLIPYDNEMNKGKIPVRKLIDIIINIIALILVVIFFFVKKDGSENDEGVLIFKAIFMFVFMVLMVISFVIKRKEYKVKILKYEVV